MHSLLYLSLDDVRSLGLGMAEILEVVEKVFFEKGLGNFEMPPKPGIHPMPDAFIHAMPSYLPRLNAAGIKWVSGFPANQEKGLPYISGLLVLNDPGTGIPISVMDCTWITAMRTGAATAVSARYCARRNSEIVGMLACGVQGRTNLEALSLVCPGLREVRAYDMDGEVQQRYVRDMAERFGFSVKGAHSPREAIEGADIIVTSGPILKHPTPVIEKGWLKKGAFISPVDFDSYVKPEILMEADRFITDDRAQILYYQSQGYFNALPSLIDELNDVVAGKIPGRVNDDELIVGMNLGISLLDMGSARLLYDRARELKIGTELPL